MEYTGLGLVGTYERNIQDMALHSVEVALTVRRRCSDSPCRWLWVDGIYTNNSSLGLSDNKIITALKDYLKNIKKTERCCDT